MLAVPIQSDQFLPFLQHLKPFLWRSATKFYTMKFNKMKRKRTRLQSHSPSKSPSSLTSQSSAHPSRSNPESEPGLRPLGWLVRYECKMGLMNEYTNEYFEACEHYSSAYAHLFSYLSQTFTPGSMDKTTNNKSKRDREAKLLFDVVAFKLIRLYFLLNQSQKATNHLKVHVARAASLTEASKPQDLLPWTTRIYSSMAELVELAQSQPGPFHSFYSSLLHYQHAEYWYLDAYQCMLKSTEPSTQIQILTKAYELFKKHKAKRGTLFVAKLIAETHFHSGNAKKALLFMERISKSYRNEGWYSLLNDILFQMIECCQTLGSLEQQLEYQLEQLCLVDQCTSSTSKDATRLLRNDFWNTLQSNAQATPISLQLQAPLLFKVNVEFEPHVVQKGGSACLSLSIEAITKCQLDQIQIVCEPETWNFTLYHSTEKENLSSIDTPLVWSNSSFFIDLKSQNPFLLTLQIPTDKLDSMLRIVQVQLLCNPSPSLHLTLTYPFSLPAATLSILTTPSSPTFQLNLPLKAFHDEPILCNVTSSNQESLPITLNFSSKQVSIATDLTTSEFFSEPFPTVYTHTPFYFFAKTMGELICTFQIQDTILRHCIQITSPFITSFSVSPPLFEPNEEVRLLLIHVSTQHSSGLDFQVVSPHLFSCLPQTLRPNKTLQCGLRHTLPLNSQLTKLDFGKMDVKWRPHSSSSSTPWITSSIKLPSASRIEPSFVITADYSKIGTQYTWHLIKLSIHNLHPTSTCQVHTFIDPCSEKDVFYAGSRQYYCTLLPQSHQDIFLECYLLIAGDVPLITCRSLIHKDDNSSSEWKSPTFSLFVEPSEKKMIDLLS